MVKFVKDKKLRKNFFCQFFSIRLGFILEKITETNILQSPGEKTLIMHFTPFIIKNNSNFSSSKIHSSSELYIISHEKLSSPLLAKKSQRARILVWKTYLWLQIFFNPNPFFLIRIKGYNQQVKIFLKVDKSNFQEESFRNQPLIYHLDLLMNENSIKGRFNKGIIYGSKKLERIKLF